MNDSQIGDMNDSQIRDMNDSQIVRTNAIISEFLNL